tara:strand:+ start:4633 stop:4908 length:276 start_codon:yes stop_codon:yes gene_type:complete
MYCYLCLNEYAGITQTFCPSCKKIKHYISLWGDRIHEILDNVLTRDIEKQDNKIKVEIKDEIDKKAYSLRSREEPKQGLKLLTSKSVFKGE